MISLPLSVFSAVGSFSLSSICSRYKNMRERERERERERGDLEGRDVLPRKNRNLTHSHLRLKFDGPSKRKIIDVN